MIFPPNPEDYEILHQIGHSLTSDLYSARCKTNNQLISIRIISMEQLPIDITNLRKGGSLWLTSSHENLSRYYGSFEVGSSLWVISEYVDGGSVRDILRYAYHHGIKNEILISAILKPVLDFLSIFHQNMHIHRAINSDVIFIKTDGTVKISNLSFASSLIKDGKRKGALFSLAYGCDSNSSCYAAPEVLSGAGYTQSSDIWSVGITAIELATGILPYEHMTEMERIKSIIDGPPPTIQSVRASQFSSQPFVDFNSTSNTKIRKSSSSKEVKLTNNSNNNCEFSPAFIDFIDQCLKKLPEKRPTVNRLLEHKFFKNMAVSLNFNLNSNNNKVIKSYISRVLMSQLPPLHERFSSLMDVKSKNYFANKNVSIKKSESTRGIHFVDPFYDNANQNQNQNGNLKQISVQKSTPNLPKKVQLNSSNTYGFLFSSDERPKKATNEVSDSVLKMSDSNSSNEQSKISNSGSNYSCRNIDLESELNSCIKKHRSNSLDEINEPLFQKNDDSLKKKRKEKNSNSDIEKEEEDQSSVQIGRFKIKRTTQVGSLPNPSSSGFLDD